MDLVLRGIVVGGLVIVIGLLSRKGNNALAALLVLVPVFSLGAFSAAASVSREGALQVISKTLLATPIWLVWVSLSYLMFRFTDLPTWGVLSLGFLAWLICSFFFLKLV